MSIEAENIAIFEEADLYTTGGLPIEHSPHDPLDAVLRSSVIFLTRGGLEMVESVEQAPGEDIAYSAELGSWAAQELKRNGWHGKLLTRVVSYSEDGFRDYADQSNKGPSKALGMLEDYVGINHTLTAVKRIQPRSEAEPESISDDSMTAGYASLVVFLHGSFIPQTNLYLIKDGLDLGRAFSRTGPVLDGKAIRLNSPHLLGTAREFFELFANFRRASEKWIASHRSGGFQTSLPLPKI